MDPLLAYPRTNPQKRSRGGGRLKVAEMSALHADSSSDTETASSATFSSARGRERGVARGSGWAPKPPCWPYRGQRRTLPKSLCPPLAHARSATSPRGAAPRTSGGLLLVVLPHGCAARRLPRLKQVRLGASWSEGGVCCQTGAQTAQKPHQGSVRAHDCRGLTRAITLAAHLTVFICSLRWWGVAQTAPATAGGRRCGCGLCGRWWEALHCPTSQGCGACIRPPRVHHAPSAACNMLIKYVAV
jgi:hypothetical protein